MGIGINDSGKGEKRGSPALRAGRINELLESICKNAGEYDKRNTQRQVRSKQMVSVMHLPF